MSKDAVRAAAKTGAASVGRERYLDMCFARENLEEKVTMGDMQYSGNYTRQCDTHRNSTSQLCKNIWLAPLLDARTGIC